MAGSGTTGGPLAGVRVVDFTWAWAGPHGTLLLAMLGAQVIKIESQTRLDHSRLRSLMAGTQTSGPDGSEIFNDLNLGKLSIRLNLRKEEAREIVRRLVALSDVVVQNMRPGVLDRLGLGYERMREVKPDIIMLSSSAVGATGPEASYAGYAPTFAALSGIASITGFPGRTPEALSGSVDLRVGTACAFAVMAALIHRQRTGQGQDIDVSSTEVMSSMMGEAFLEYEMTGRIPERMGNRHEAMAPHGCYRCRGEGQAEPVWISIAVGSDEEWQALKQVIGDPELDDEAFSGAIERWGHQDRLDAAITRWTLEREPYPAARALQQAGVAAVPVYTAADLVNDPHVVAREVLQTVEHPVIGSRDVVGPPWRLDGAGIRGPAPCIGEHSEYVLREVLGLEPDEIGRLEAEGVLD